MTTVPVSDAPSPTRTGPLRNGNPRGNPNLAPRCGARTRAGGCCQAPALRGRTRCKCHGGASTGPRTQAGLARVAAAHTTHGRCRQQTWAEFAHLRLVQRCSRVLAQAARYRLWLPAALRARLEAGEVRELVTPPHPSWIVGATREEVLGRGTARDARGRFVARPVVLGWGEAVRRMVRERQAALRPWEAAIAAVRVAKRRAKSMDRGDGGGAGAADRWDAGLDRMDREDGGTAGGMGGAAGPTVGAVAAAAPDLGVRVQDSMDRENGGDAGAAPDAAPDAWKSGHDLMDRENGRDAGPSGRGTRTADPCGRDQNLMDRDSGRATAGTGTNRPPEARAALPARPGLSRSPGPRDERAPHGAESGRRGNNPMDRESGDGPPPPGWAGAGPLVTRLWGDVASPAMGLRARLLGGTRHDGSPFWIAIDGGWAGLLAGIAAGEDTDAALAARARYVRR